MFLSEIPLLFRRNVINLNVALVTVSTPDHKGYCSLGTSVDCARAAVINADYIIGETLFRSSKFFGPVMSLSPVGIRYFLPIKKAYLNLVLGLANPNMPRTFGDGIIHSSHVDVMVFDDHPIHERPFGKLGEIELQIGALIAENLVEDGATLQMGKG